MRGVRIESGMRRPNFPKGHPPPPPFLARVFMRLAEFVAMLASPLARVAGWFATRDMDQHRKECRACDDIFKEGDRVLKEMMKR